MRRRARHISAVSPQRPKDKVLVPVVAVFIGLCAAALVFGWLEQPDEFRQTSGTVTSVAPRRPDSRVVVAFVKLDDGGVVRCSRLAGFGVGSRVVVSIARTGLLRREITDC